MATPVTVPLVADRIRKIRMLLNEISDDLAITDEQAKALSKEATFFLDKLGDRLESVNDPIDEVYPAACAYDREVQLSPKVIPAFEMTKANLEDLLTEGFFRRIEELSRDPDGKLNRITMRYNDQLTTYARSVKNGKRWVVTRFGGDERTHYSYAFQPVSNISRMLSVLFDLPESTFTPEQGS